MIALSVSRLTGLFAHQDSTSGGQAGLLGTVSHQPTWSALIISFIILFAWFAVLALFHVKLISRLLALIPAILVLSVLFFNHNQIVATILMSSGFILAFTLSFTMLRAGK